MKRLFAFLAVLLLLLVAVLLFRAFTLPSKQLTAAAAAPLEIDRPAALARFSRAIQFRTISFEDRKRTGEHEAFLAWLTASYPRVHATMQRETIHSSLLYTWRGSDPSLPPVLMMGHYDVVPIEPGTESKWEQPPFSGAVVNGYVWGRGTLDDKISVIGLMEAAESLLARGYQPRRTVLFQFGEDEEIGGNLGASQVAKTLAGRGVKLDAVLDEGGAITTGAFAGDLPVAVIGIAEKGMASVEISASSQGGHSSMPPPQTAVGMVAAAVARLEKQQLAASISGPTAEMFRWLAPELPLGKRVVLANLWLFEPLLKLQARTSHSLNAMLRTTTAATMISGGVKDNIIPSHASAVVNFRILPSDSVRAVIHHVTRVAGDSRVHVRLWNQPWEPSPVSDTAAPQFRAVQEAIDSVFPKAVVTPYLVVGATDSRYYRPLTRNAYRFTPVTLAEADLARVHGTNERIPVEGYFDAIRWYRQLLTNLAK